MLRLVASPFFDLEEKKKKRKKGNSGEKFEIQKSDEAESPSSA